MRFWALQGTGRTAAGGAQRRASRHLATAVHAVSLLVLLLVLTAAVTSRKITPFYGWIRDTPIERLGHGVTGVVNHLDLLWRRRLAGAPLLKAEARARDSLIAEIERIRPTHGLILRDGSRFFGRLSRPQRNVWRIEYEGDDRRLIRDLKPEELRWHKEIVYPPVDLLPEDIRFLLNFPGFKYYHMPPFLVVSDAPYYSVHEAFDILGDFHTEFAAAFRVLMTRDTQPHLYYVCFFRDEETYLAHAIAKEEAELENSVGFYSQVENCLFVYDRLNSLARQKIDQYIDKLAQQAAARKDEVPPETIRALAEADRQRAYEALSRQVVETLRHEGAHQLAFSLGVHATQTRGLLWVEEGLAQYCETRPIGLLMPDKLDALRQALERHALVPWPELADTAAADGFGADGGRTPLAYAQSWLMFHYLMQPLRQARFLAFLERIREIRTADANRTCSEVLADCLGTPFERIAQALNDIILDRQEPAPAGKRGETKAAE